MKTAGAAANLCQNILSRSSALVAAQFCVASLYPSFSSKFPRLLFVTVFSCWFGSFQFHLARFVIIFSIFNYSQVFRSITKCVHLKMKVSSSIISIARARVFFNIQNIASLSKAIAVIGKSFFRLDPSFYVGSYTSSE